MPVQELAEAFRLEATGPGTYTAPNHEMGERGLVFGGQLIGQMIAAGATADETKRVKSAQAIFARPVMVADPVELRVDVLQSGRTFASATVSMWQYDKERSRALVLLTADEPDMIRNNSEMPTVPGPDEVTPLGDNPDVRVVGGADIWAADEVGPPNVQVWFRNPEAGTGPTGQALLAHNTATMLIGSAMRPHAGLGQDAAHASFSTGIIAHTISFHEPIDISDWHLVASANHYAGRGRVFGGGEVFRTDGQLVASFSQEAMIRHFSDAGGETGHADVL